MPGRSMCADDLANLRLRRSRSTISCTPNQCMFFVSYWGHSVVHLSEMHFSLVKQAKEAEREQLLQILKDKEVNDPELTFRPQVNTTINLVRDFRS